MSIFSLLASIAYYLLLIYFFVLWARLILDLARTFVRGWRPHGFGLVLAELVYSLTDRPVGAMRRVIPPVRVGGVALDFAWSVVMLAVIILMSIMATLSATL
jgi:YggT family protein